MLNNVQDKQWLAKKFLLFSLGMYATIAGIFGLKQLGLACGIISPFNILVAFLLTIFARTFYEQLVILDIPLQYINLGKNTLFALLYAIIMSIVFCTIKAPLGYLGIPVAMIIAQALIKPIKAYLWQSKPRQGLYELYTAKQGLFMTSLYGFYGLIALLAVAGIKILHMPFAFAFFSAVFIALLASSLYELQYLYEHKITRKTLLTQLCIALLLAATITAAVIIAITKMGISGSAATIIGCIAVKTIQHYCIMQSLS
jgi:hypothetical protein